MLVLQNLESFGSGIWRPLLAPSNYTLHSRGPFLVSKFRDSNVRKNAPSVVFLGVGGATEAVVPSPLSRGSVLTPRQRSPQSQVVDRASGFLEQGLVGTVMTWNRLPSSSMLQPCIESTRSHLSACLPARIVKTVSVHVRYTGIRVYRYTGTQLYRSMYRYVGK